MIKLLDEVWVMCRNKPTKVLVVDITKSVFNPRSKEPLYETFYRVYEEVLGDFNYKNTFVVNENEGVFETKKELIENL